MKHCTYRQEVVPHPARGEAAIDLEDDEVIIDTDTFDGQLYLLIQRCEVTE